MSYTSSKELRNLPFISKVVNEQTKVVNQINIVINQMIDNYVY